MKALALVLLGILAIPAFANDGGVVGVDASDLKIEKVTGTSDNQTRTPIEVKDWTESIEATFTGKVDELFKYLPPQRSVFKEVGEYNRSLAIAAEEGNVSINCSSADVTFDEEGKVVVTPRKTTCSISFQKYPTPMKGNEKFDYFGDFEELEVPPACKMK